MKSAFCDQNVINRFNVISAYSKQYSTPHACRNIELSNI